MQSKRTLHTQRGAAILLAMLILVLITSLAAGSVWRQSQVLEVEAAERDRAQAVWILNGMLDWSRLILKEDDKNKEREDNLDETWAKELKESSLSAFLAVDKNNSGGRDERDITKAYFSGRMQDLNRGINLNDLIASDGKSLDPEYERIVDRLFTQLGIAKAETDIFKQAYLRAAQNSTGSTVSGVGASVPKKDALKPGMMEQLDWLGISADVLNQVRPYLYIANLGSRGQRIPQNININTTSATMLQAVIDGCDANCAEQIIQRRGTKPFLNKLDLFTAFPALDKPANAELPLDGKSELFKVLGRLRLENLQVEETAILWRPSVNQVIVLQREQASLGDFISSDGPNSTSLEELKSELDSEE